MMIIMKMQVVIIKLMERKKVMNQWSFEWEWSVIQGRSNQILPNKFWSNFTTINPLYAALTKVDKNALEELKRISIWLQDVCFNNLV